MNRLAWLSGIVVVLSVAVICSSSAQESQDNVSPSLPTDSSLVSSTSNSTNEPTPSPKPKKGFVMIKVDFLKVKTPFIIVIWVIVASLFKLVFSEIPERFRKHIPESFFLLMSGIIMGYSLIYTQLVDVGPLTPTTFFIFLLPPIVFEAGYFMPNRLFFDNLLTILVFAVIGTIFNAFLIGGTLYGLGYCTGCYDIPVLHAFLFGSIAAAVDPVAVLAVFEEIHVNDVLYIIVFGESLLNDAVTVVLYQLFENYSAMGLSNIQVLDIAKGFVSFLYVALGGALIGIVWGFFSAYLTSLTHKVRMVEPMLVFALAYLSYLLADMLHLSGILALTFCGITMKNYVEENISHKSHVTIKSGSKMFAASSETVIFIFLGMAIFSDTYEWNFPFIAFTLILCSVYRCLGVVILSTLVNHFRLHQINRIEQFILSYGGLRGAVAFALVLIVDPEIIPAKNMMVSAIMVLVFFTVMLQGLSIGTLVRWLKVPLSENFKISMNERIHHRFMDHLMAGVEGIVGSKMGNHNLRDKFKYYNNKYLRPYLTRNHSIADPKIFETYSKLNLADAFTIAKQNGKLTPNHNSMETAPSLSAILRNYTQSNLPKMHKPCMDDPTEKLDIPPLDMAELEYSPSNKDLADAQLHHILNDAMNKHVKRHHHHHHHHHHNDHNNYKNCEGKDPTQQHRLKLHLNHLGKSGHPHHRSIRRSDANEESHNNDDPEIPSKKSETTLRFQLPDEDVDQPSPLSSAASHDDEGIIFTVRSARSSISEDSGKPEANVESLMDADTELEKLERPKDERTLGEKTLPWMRGDNGQLVCNQKEFPSWMDNKDYVSYLSPTTTYLDKIDQPRPDVFEVFGLEKDPRKLQSQIVINIDDDGIQLTKL